MKKDLLENVLPCERRISAKLCVLSSNSHSLLIDRNFERKRKKIGEKEKEINREILYLFYVKNLTNGTHQKIS